MDKTGEGEPGGSRRETIKEGIERGVREQQAEGSARQAAAKAATAVSEQDHWRRHFEVSVFPKVGAADLVDFLILCDLQGRAVPEQHRSDYVWLHHNRQEWMLEFSSAENRAMLASPHRTLNSPGLEPQEEAHPDSEFVRGYNAALVERRGFAQDRMEPNDTDEPASFQQMLETLFEKNYDVMMARQRKYGPHNIPKRGTSGTMTRMIDKFARIEFAEAKHGTLEQAWNDELAADESIEDTLVDIANYATIMRAQLHGWWTKTFCPPVAKEDE